MGLSKRKMAHESTVKDLLGGENTRRTRSVISEEAMHHVLESLTHNYQNPIEGLVRETISNGIDATILLPEAERRPVEVISPSSYNMQFTVIDHGIGMDLKTLEQHFVQYGLSLKLDDFEQTGSFGMGAKAPLAYTHEFKAVTVKDGVKITYIVQRENSGIWGNPIKIEDTDEPNGTTITVALESEEDIGEFNRVTNEYLKHSYDLPIIVDGKESTFFDHYVEVGSIVMDESSGTAGRVWMLKDNFYRFMLLNENRGGFIRSLDIRYLVAGWEYELLGNSRKDLPDAYVELKPGLVNFNQSRDSIVDNERAKRLKLLIQRVLFDDDATIRDYMIRAFNQLTVKEAATVLKELNQHETLRTLSSENGKPVDGNRTIRIREMLMAHVNNPLYEHGYDIRRQNVDSNGKVYREFQFTVDELANRDGNAVLDMLMARERGETIRYMFTMTPDHQPDERHYFDVLTGGYGNAWDTRNQSEHQYDEGKFDSTTTLDPQIIPQYMTPDRKGILTQYGRVARAGVTAFDVVPEYLYTMDNVHNIILVINEDGANAATLVRQRERIARLFKDTGVTALDGTKQQYVEPSTDAYSRFVSRNSMIAIGHISAADVDTLPTPGEHRNVVIVNYEMLREDLRKQNSKERVKNVKNPEAETAEQLREARVFRLDVNELLGQTTATAHEIAAGAIREYANWSYQKSHAWIKPNRSNNEQSVTLQEIQAENGIVIISPHTVVDNYSRSYDADNTPELITQVLVDRANAGYDITDGTTFYVFNSRAFNAQDQTYLSEHIDNLYIARSWRYASKASDALRAQYTIQGNILQSAFDGLTDLEIATFSMRGDLQQMESNRVAMEVLGTLLQDDTIRETARIAMEFMESGHNATNKVELLYDMQQFKWTNGNVSEHLPSYESKDFSARIHRVKRYFNAFLKTRSELADFEHRSRRSLFNTIDVSSLSTQYAMEAGMAYNLLDMITGQDALQHGEHAEDLLKIQTLRDILSRQAVTRLEDKLKA